VSCVDADARRRSRRRETRRLDEVDSVEGVPLDPLVADAADAQERRLTRDGEIGVRGGRASSNGSGEDAHLRAVVVELEAQEVGRRLLDDDALLLKPEGERRVELRLDGEVLLGRRLK